MDILQNDVIAAIIAFGLVLIPAIIIHELGHFFAAKWAGITVLEFGIGFPPRIRKLFSWGETEFTLNWIPLGGYVRPLGEGLVGPMSDEEVQQERNALVTEWEDEDDKSKNEEFYSEREELIARGVREEDLKAVHEVKPIPRIIFMAAGAFANFASAIVLFAIIGLLGVPFFLGGRMQVLGVSSETTLSELGIANGDVIEQVDGRYFTDVPAYLNEIAALGDSVNLTMLRISDGSQYAVTVPASALAVEPAILITGIQEDSPASATDLELEDIILALNGTPITNREDPVSEIQSLTEESAGTAIALTILRDGKMIESTITPRVDPPAGQGRMGIQIRAEYLAEEGIHFTAAPDQFELRPLNLLDSARFAFDTFFDVLRTIASIPAQLIQGTISPEEARPVSIIGISQIGGQILRQSVTDGSPSTILEFIALVSIFLGVTNLLPIPALDGGRILFVIIEMVRGKPVPPEQEGRVHLIGIIILLGLGVLVMVYDVLNPFILPG